MKEFCKKLSDVLKTVFGYGIMIALFAGGLTFFGYMAALIIGGDIAASICAFIYNTVLPAIIYLSVIMVLLGMIAMYLAGEVSLTPEKKHAHKHKGEI
jgi:uncharacterized membrane protein YozB (DUF420 family)